MLSAVPMAAWLQADAGKINRDKGAKTGLKIGDKEVQPIEAIRLRVIPPNAAATASALSR
jgi:hypothetical protein